MSTEENIKYVKSIIDHVNKISYEHEQLAKELGLRSSYYESKPQQADNHSKIAKNLEWYEYPEFLQYSKGVEREFELVKKEYDELYDKYDGLRQFLTNLQVSLEYRSTIYDHDPNILKSYSDCIKEKLEEK